MGKSGENDLAALIIAYSRPAGVTYLINTLNSYGITNIYVSIDGPKNARDKINQKKINKEIARYNQEHIKKINVVRREVNSGAAAGVISAIDWFFSHEKAGIILEDDCLPVKDFFNFCEKLLKKYLNNKLINSIGGSNFCKKKISEIYYFSKYNHIWGWATWRRSWKNFDLNIKFWKKYKNTNHWKSLHDNDNEKEYWEKKFDKIYEGSIYTWDYSWQACAWYKSQLSIIPNKPLVKNVGFDDEATYTIGRNFNYNAIRTNLIIDNNNGKYRYYYRDRICSNCWLWNLSDYGST
jgi:hypothetical protein